MRMTLRRMTLWRRIIQSINGVADATAFGEVERQINVRVDGGPWTTPPGIPTMHDTFGGDVGMIVVAEKER